MTPAWIRSVGAGAAAGAVLTLAAGCGGGSATTRSSAARAPAAARAAPSPPSPGRAPQSIPAPGPSGRAADPAAVRVIRAWSQALRRGDITAAARYFALPSEMINGVGANGLVSVIAIATQAQAQAANISLPCGARFVSADQRGPYVNVLFVLTQRPGRGGGCGTGVGQIARTNFLVAGGRIREWVRAPLDPGDSGGASPPPSAPQNPPAPQIPGASPVI